MFQKESWMQFQIRNLKEKVAAFESGKQYQKLQEDHRKELAEKDRKIRELEKETARSHAETVDVRNKWIETCEDVLKEKEKALKKKDREVEKAREAMYQAQQERDKTLEELREAKKKIRDLECQLYQSQGQIQQLTVRINKDYTNSSKPSSTSPNHGKIQNSREATGRRPGGQPGHPHHERKRREPDRTIQIPAPLEYQDRKHYNPTGRMIRKQLICLRVSTEVIEYVTPEFQDRETGQKVHARFPEGVCDDVNYDGSVKAAAYLLNQKCNVSIGNTCQFLKEITGGAVSLSTGMVCNLAREFSGKTKDERNEIFLRLAGKPSMHADFTFGRVNGKQAAILICAAPGVVLYQAREKKGHEGVQGSPLVPYHGTVISDHEATFHHYGDHHQECLVHVERYLRSSIENEPELKWNKEMLEWVKSSIHYWNIWQESGVANTETVAEMEAKYDAILKKAKEEYEYEIPSEYYKDGYRLYQRMAEAREDYLQFLHDKNVAPTNNLAERYARKVKRKVAQVMGFRSQEGLIKYCDGLTVIQTLEAVGENLFDAVARRFDRCREAGV